MTDLEERLLAMLEQEREMNTFLLQALLPQQQTVTISGVPKSIGRIPWNNLKAKLEKKFRRTDGQEPISDTDEQHDAGGDHGTERDPEVAGESDPEVPCEEKKEVQ